MQKYIFNVVFYKRAPAGALVKDNPVLGPKANPVYPSFHHVTAIGRPNGPLKFKGSSVLPTQLFFPLERSSERPYTLLDWHSYDAINLPRAIISGSDFLANKNERFN